jgi:hypothetical protein
MIEEALDWHGGFDDIAPATTGSGPWDEDAFDDLLRRCGIEPQAPESGIEVLVVGSSDWRPDLIREIVWARSGQDLRVYSQELYLAYLCVQSDPLREQASRLLSLAGSHPALSFLSGLGFDWPNTTVVSRLAGGFDPAFIERGFLGYLGYKVGSRGKPVVERQGILEQALRRHIPPEHFPPFYCREWGDPDTCHRLRKIAECIASFCRLAKLRRRPPKQAIQDWENDLEWLHRNLYGRCTFQWPSTRVP